MVQPEDILEFWFDELKPAQWWAVDAALDAQMHERFLPTLEQAARCELAPWRSTACGRLAEVIVLDQFSRNIFRNAPRAFAQDPLALGLAQEAVAGGALQALEPAQRSFLLMPYMHSESRWIHELTEPLFKEWAAANNYRFELRHKEIIDRFGRYPHRNAILGRESTAEEREFLTQPGSSF